MKRFGKNRIKPVIVVALLVGILLHVAFFAVLRLQIPTFAYEPEARSFIDYENPNSKMDSQIQEQALLLDSAPLFMPTQWNTASNYDSIVSLEEAARAFYPFGPDIELSQEKVRAKDLTESHSWDVMGFLPSRSAFQFQALGTSLESTKPFSRLKQDRLGLLVSDFQGNAFSGEILIDSEIQESAPRIGDNPLEWWVHLENGQVRGVPQLVVGSSSAEWNQIFAAFLWSNFQFSKSLDGYFRVQVFP